MFSKYRLFIFSPDPDKLVTFYRDILDMKILKKLELPKDYGYSIEVAPEYTLWIAKHSEVSGHSREPVRTMLNIYCDEIERYFAKIKISGVKIIQEPICMGEFNPGEERFVFTFHDPEGNCLQFMGKMK